MIFQSHIRMANSISHALPDLAGARGNKFLLLAGSVAPDLKCMFPSHRINLTKRRFIERLHKVENLRGKHLRMFWQGVVLHYICDYFCLAHNAKSIHSGPSHTKYEIELNRFIKEHLEGVDSLDSDGQVSSSLDELDEIICDDLADHLLALREASLDDIYDVVWALNAKYMELGKQLRDKVHLDMVMARRVGLTLMSNPVFQ